MRGLTRRWILRPDAPAAGAGAVGLDRRILGARGILAPDEVARFTDPRLTDLHDPDLLPGVPEAAERLAEALRGGKRIAIYGDYDVDGISATAILHHVFRALKPDASVRAYVPHRLDEGYGLNAQALRTLASEGAEVIVTVDCGVTAIEEAALARELGVELIVTDHHEPRADGAMPDALVVHPQRPDGAYPFSDLCGAGVAYKLAWSLARRWAGGSDRLPAVLRETLVAMLPLAAMGTVADVVPLRDENRIIVRFGLQLVRATRLPGLRALLEACELMNERIGTEQVGFVLGPRLNACGRMGHAAEAVRLLTDAPPAEATEIAQRLAKLNQERQRTERRIVAEAEAMAEAAGMTGPDRRAIVLAHPDWHPGVVGIVCSRLVDRHARPALLMQLQGDVAKGSARSVDGYSIHAALHACGHLLTQYGGHEMAAGVTMPSANVDALAEALVAHANGHLAPEDLVPSISIDCAVDLGELHLGSVRAVEALAPFGRANRRPTLLLSDLRIAADPRPIGKEGRHLELRLVGGASSAPLRAIWWDGATHLPRLRRGVRLDAAVEPKINSYLGTDSVEAEVRDVRVIEHPSM